MATPAVIEVEDLLHPISDDVPAGPDLRDDPSPTSPYQTIKNERNLARAAERQSIHDGESQEAMAHWRATSEQAPQIVRDNAKDLEIASWYTEAMLRRYGFAGLRDGFALIKGLIENYWQPLHPMPDEYGMETRTSCLAGLNGEGAEGVLIAPIRKVPLTDGDVAYSLWEYHLAHDAQNTADDDVRKSKLANLGYGPSDIEESVGQSSEQFYIDLRDDLSECIDLYKSIGQMLDEHCGIHDAPPTRTIVEVLEETLGVVKHIGKAKFPLEAAEGNVEENTEVVNADGTTTVVQQVVQKGPVANREDAFKQLNEIADFFLKTEPHSPISYVLQKAVKWGNMSLPDLIEELIPDRSSREHFGELTGVETED